MDSFIIIFLIIFCRLINKTNSFFPEGETIIFHFLSPFKYQSQLLGCAKYFSHQSIELKRREKHHYS